MKEMLKVVVCSLSLVALLLALAACSTSSPTAGVVVRTPAPAIQQVPGPVTYEMNVSQFRLVPEKLILRPGDRIRFTNNNGRRHKIIEQSWRMFESPWLDIGQSYEHTFNKQGRYVVEVLDYEMERKTKYRDTHPRVPITGVVEVIR